MKDFAGVVEMQVESLLGTLQRQQATRCQEISRVAKERATQLLKAVRRQSSDRMRQAVVQERQRIDAALSQAHGRMRTQERKHLQHHYQGLLQEGWPLLETSMRARWENPGQRRAWCESLVADAIAVFGAAPLTIEHPSDWPEEEQAWLVQVLREAAGGDAAFNADESVAGGLRIRTPHACLDGTLNGLLGNRREVEAILLAAWEQAAAKSAGEAPAAPDAGSSHG